MTSDLPYKRAGSHARPAFCLGTRLRGSEIVSHNQESKDAKNCQGLIGNGGRDMICESEPFLSDLASRTVQDIPVVPNKAVAEVGNL